MPGRHLVWRKNEKIFPSSSWILHFRILLFFLPPPHFGSSFLFSKDSSCPQDGNEGTFPLPKTVSTARGLPKGTCVSPRIGRMSGSISTENTSLDCVDNRAIIRTGPATATRPGIRGTRLFCSRCEEKEEEGC